VSRSASPRRRGVRVRPHPADLRVRGQLPHPEVPAVAEHRGAQRVHLRCHAGAPPGSELGRCVQNGPGPPRRVAGAQPQLVDHRRGPVRVHRDQPAVQGDVDRVHGAGLLRALRVLQALGGVRRNAVPRNLVLPDPRAHRRPAQEPRANARLTPHLVRGYISCFIDLVVEL
jgi:hypothetical protein